jgi:ribosomal protein S27AE
MLDVIKAEAQAAQWGIDLRTWMELQVRFSGNVDEFGDVETDDKFDEEWRGRVADVLVENGLASKGNRYLQCSRYAYLYECEGEARHKLFSPIYCDLRFCPRCAPRRFARLIKKYEPILKSVCANQKADFRLREITFTTVNTGSLNSAAIKQFNLDIKETLKALMRGIKGWGAIWCDEVGFNNTNLHAHVLLYGPYITETRLGEMWKQVSGHEVVWIRLERRSGGEALIHMLKYVSKPPANDPQLIGHLEVAFHTTRCVHSMGLFYNFVGQDTDNIHSAWETCPHCGAGLTKLPGSTRIETAILDGRTFVGTKHTVRRKEWVN